MFGYIKPYQPELRFREMAQYRAAYCGLCHTLSKRYGATARMLVNYDFVLLVMLFWAGPYDTHKRRCILHPFRKRCAACRNAALDYAADALMLFTDWKLKDAVSDSRVALLSRLIRRIYKKPFRKAAARLPSEAAECLKRMGELARFEKQNDPGFGSVYAFGSMLASLSSFFRDEENRRAAHSLLFHLGNWITLADAVNDEKRDGRKGVYNPVTASGAGREAVFSLLGREQELALTAFDLLPENEFTEIGRNILSLGLQSIGHDIYTKGGTAIHERSI